MSRPFATPSLSSIKSGFRGISQYQGLRMMMERSKGQIPKKKAINSALSNHPNSPKSLGPRLWEDQPPSAGPHQFFTTQMLRRHCSARSWG